MIRTIVCGYGRWGSVLAARAREHAAFDVIGVAEPEKAQLVRAAADGFSVWSTLEDALEEQPQLVVVATPIMIASRMSVLASSSGAHVLVAKPGAVSTSTAMQMINAATRNERSLTVDYTLLVSPKWQRIRALSDSLGQVRYMDATRTTPTQRSASELISDLCVHDLSLVSDISFGREWRVIRSSSSPLRARVILEDSEARVGVYARRTDSTQDRHCHVVFEHGYATWDQLRDTLTTWSNGDSTYEGPERVDLVTRRFDQVRRVIEDGEADNRAEFVRVTQLLEAALEAPAYAA